MGGLGDITFADIARALGRYRPVAFTVLAIVVLVAVLPGHRPSRSTSGSGLASTSGVGGIRASAAPPAPAAGTEVAGASADSAGVGGGAIGDTTDTSLAGGNLGSSSSSFTSSSPSAGGGYSYAPPSASSDDGGDDSSSTPTTSLAGSDAGGAYAISAATWSTGTGAGTPLATANVPAGDLPVGTHLGSDDKRSFVRLTGGGSGVLTLKVDAGGARPAVNGTAAIRACQITAAGWTENPGSSFADEPAYDDGACVSGKPSADGTTWTFALSSFANPADARGVALVPDKTSATDFQVTFTR